MGGGTQGRLGSPGDRDDYKACPPEQCLATGWEQMDSCVCQGECSESQGGRAVPSLLLCKLNKPYSLSLSLYLCCVRIENLIFSAVLGLTNTLAKSGMGKCSPSKSHHQCCLVTTEFPDIPYKGQLQLRWGFPSTNSAGRGSAFLAPLQPHLPPPIYCFLCCNSAPCLAKPDPE